MTGFYFQIETRHNRVAVPFLCKALDFVGVALFAAKIPFAARLRIVALHPKPVARKADGSLYKIGVVVHDEYNVAVVGRGKLCRPHNVPVRKSVVHAVAFDGIIAENKGFKRHCDGNYDYNRGYIDDCFECFIHFLCKQEVCQNKLLFRLEAYSAESAPVP